MAKFDKDYKALIQDVLTNGREYTNARRGVTRLEIPSYNHVHNMADGFPLLTSKYIPFKSIVTELFWFLRGDTTIDYLHEHGCHIWDKDAEKWGDGKNIGIGYGVMWREIGSMDQLAIVLCSMMADLNGSRNLVQAFIPHHHLLDTTALPPCHTGFQIIAVRGGFRLKFNMRSWDLFLGAPFNWASYALLGMLFERETGHKFVDIEVSASCIHLYGNQIDAAQDFLNEPEFNAPTVDISGVPKGIWSIDVCKTLTPDMVKLNGYEYGKRFNVEML